MILLRSCIKLDKLVVKGVFSDIIDQGVNMLQYADDTIFLLPDDDLSALNLKIILCAFEQMSGLTTNFHESEHFLFGEVVNKSTEYRRIFTCHFGDLPMRYLGVPGSDKRILDRNWKPVENKIE